MHLHCVTLCVANSYLGTALMQNDGTSQLEAIYMVLGDPRIGRSTNQSVGSCKVRIGQFWESFSLSEAAWFLLAEVLAPRSVKKAKVVTLSQLFFEAASLRYLVQNFAAFFFPSNFFQLFVRVKGLPSLLTCVISAFLPPTYGSTFKCILIFCCHHFFRSSLV